MKLAALYILAFYFYLFSFALAETDQNLTRCLHRAEQSPDYAVAEAQAWLKKGGGDQAKVCHAFAQFHRGEFEAAASEFAFLAAKKEKGNPSQSVSFHTQAGLSAMRAGNFKMAEAEYSAALRIEPHDPDIWLDRATLLAGNERYWEALEDVNRALEIMPDMPEAIKLRAQVRTKLGQKSAAISDFEYARSIEEAERSESSLKSFPEK